MAANERPPDTPANHLRRSEARSGLADLRLRNDGAERSRRYGVAADAAPLDLDALFGRTSRESSILACDGEAVVTRAANRGDISSGEDEPASGPLPPREGESRESRIARRRRGGVELGDGSVDAVNLFFRTVLPARHHKRRSCNLRSWRSRARAQAERFAARRDGLGRLRGAFARGALDRGVFVTAKNDDAISHNRSRFGRRRNLNGEAGGWLTTRSTSSIKTSAALGWAD
jgi:hypothetical protein